MVEVVDADVVDADVDDADVDDNWEDETGVVVEEEIRFHLVCTAIKDLPSNNDLNASSFIIERKPRVLPPAVCPYFATPCSSIFTSELVHGGGLCVTIALRSSGSTALSRSPS